MRPVVLRGLTAVLLAAAAVGALRLPVTLLRSPDGDRVDLTAPASVPSHVVRLPAPAIRSIRTPERRVQATTVAPRTRVQATRRSVSAPRPATGPKAAAPAARRAVRIIRAEPSTQQSSPAPTPLPEPVVASAPATESAPATTPVAFSEPAAKREPKGDAKPRKAKKNDRALATVTAAVQLPGSTEAPAPPRATGLAVAAEPEERSDRQSKHDDRGHDDHGRAHDRD